SIAPIGLALTAAGTLYMILIGRFIMPNRQGTEDLTSKFKLREYVTELRIHEDSPFVGKTVGDLHADRAHELEIDGMVRRGRRLAAPFARRRIQDGDVLLIRATPEQLVSFTDTKGVELEPVAQYSDGEAKTKGNGNGNGNGKRHGDEAPEEELVQAVLAPRSNLAGRTLRDVNFKRRYGAVVVGLWRQERVAASELASTKLKAGDVLVLDGDEDAIARVSEDRDFLMIVPF